MPGRARLCIGQHISILCNCDAPSYIVLLVSAICILCDSMADPMPDDLPVPEFVMKQRHPYSRLRRHVKASAIILLFSAISLLLYSHLRKSSSLPLPLDGAPAVGFDLTESYGFVTILFLARIVLQSFFTPRQSRRNHFCLTAIRWNKPKMLLGV